MIHITQVDLAGSYHIKIIQHSAPMPQMLFGSRSINIITY